MFFSVFTTLEYRGGGGGRMHGGGGGITTVFQGDFRLLYWNLFSSLTLSTPAHKGGGGCFFLIFYNFGI